MDTECSMSIQPPRPATIETSRHNDGQGVVDASNGKEIDEKERTRDGYMHDSCTALAMDEGEARNPSAPLKTMNGKEVKGLRQHRNTSDQGVDWHKRGSQRFDDASSKSESEAGVDVIRPASRRNNVQGSITASTDSQNTGSLPSLRRKETKLMQKEAHPWEHLGITLGLPMILLFDLIVPCVIYYTWYDTQKWNWKKQCREDYPDQKCPVQQPEFDKAILGYAIISFGFGELWILIARVWRLFLHPEECAPLLSRNRWELDATCWVYAVAMLMALIPFVVGSSLEIPKLYLYSPSFIMGFLGTLMAITICVPFKIPIGINSHARGSKLRPFIYYAAEDFIAVDGLQDREFRVRYNERYETNKMFRRFFVYLTLWWILGVCVYIGCVSVVIWTLEFHYAFGLSFGVLFSYIAIWASVTAVWTRLEMKREHKAYEEGKIDC
jgi:hypothetical protein